ncbi:MAG: LacI family DNA-binding transcriptional regulator [Oscillospiraceae bacterium]|nr:LacI family DNA-binding transcriptional regulator [Oscillospiraceae bacterium]
MPQKQNLTIDDIAHDLGVSKTTVSRAISGKGRISEATRSKIMEYVEQRNYRPSAAAKGLAESRTYNLALVLPKSFIRMDLPHVRHSMNAICEEAFIWDYNILICLSTEEFPESLLRTLDNRKVDGVILSRTAEGDALVDVLKDRGIPFATIGSLPPRARGWATVEADHDQEGGCYAFTKVFLQGSSDQAALLGNDMRYIVNQSRLAGFSKAIEAIKFPRDNIHLRTGLGNPSACSAAAQELLNKGVRKFLCMDDEICLYTYAALLEAGMKIPEDVQIASLFDSEKLAQCPTPISALRFDAAELGKTACRELLRCLRNETYDPKPTLGYRLIIRDSTL